MAIERVFLGLDEPVLLAAARWLLTKYQGAMDEVTVVLPTARAGRRLVELMVELVEGPETSTALISPAEPQADTGFEGVLLAPPRVVTVGGLPELLTEQSATEDRTAGDLEAWSAWVGALREASAEDREALGLDSESQRYAGVWQAADELIAARSELAAHRFTIGQAAGQLDDPRWRAAAAIERAALERLSRWGVRDIHAVREQGLGAMAARDQTRLDAQRRGNEVVLIGVSDLSRLARDMVMAWAEQGGSVTSLVAGRDESAESFGAVGELLEDEAANADAKTRPPVVAEDRLLVVDGPREVAAAVLRAVGGAGRADDVSVALANEKLGAGVERVLEAHGWPARQATGRGLKESRPGRMLSAASAFLRSQRFDDFAAMLRHPDVPINVAVEERSEESEATREDWLSLLDEYLTAHVQGRVSGTFIGRGQQRLVAMWEAITRWLPASQRSELREVVDAWARAMGEAYGGRQVTAQSRLGRALRMTASTLDELRELPDDVAEALGDLDAAGLAELVVWRMGRQSVPEPGESAAVELIGWLELPWDDAPVAALAGVSEEVLPGSGGESVLLGNATRKRLGLRDDGYRLRRDRWLLDVVMSTRPSTTVIASRLSAEGDPLRPSRLLLDLRGEALAKRVRRFDLEEKGDVDGNLAGLPAGREDDSAMKRIGLDAPIRPPRAVDHRTLDKLSVTAFRDYLTSPYRFYLSRILKVGGIDDSALEMDGGVFGSLAHRVFEQWAWDEAASWDKAEPLQKRLEAILDSEVGKQFGSSPQPAVMIQRQHLLERLHAFARWQAQQAAEGWRVDPTRAEQEWTHVLDVDGKPLTVAGRVDRIDVHDELGYRVIDYKTSESLTEPRDAHLSAGRWIDLQLPLYGLMAKTAGLGDAVMLGYFSLPAKLKDVGWYHAKWEPHELEQAVAVATDIIRRVRSGELAELGDPARWDDGLSGLCGDRLAERDVWAKEEP